LEYSQALLNFLLPEVFHSSDVFSEWFGSADASGDGQNEVVKKLHQVLGPFLLRRLKVDVEKSLPPKTETILFTGLSTMQKNLYKQILLRDIDTVNGTSAGRTAVLNIVMQLMHLQQFKML
jgi:SWI/SNF-related matrix-associated actin-dependent regulator of chromatin subfamily A member 5